MAVKTFKSSSVDIDILATNIEAIRNMLASISDGQLPAWCWTVNCGKIEWNGSQLSDY